MSLTGWRYYKDIVIDHNKIDEDLIDFPVAVKLDSSNFDFNKAQTNGNDMRFCLKNGTLLSYERELHDSVNQEAVYWVKIPTTYSSVDTTFRMYFGNSSAVDGANPTNVWDNNFKLVTHMNDNPDNAHIKDSTINGNNGTKYAAEQPTETDGIIGKAQSFDGVDDYIDCGNNTSLNPTDAITIEVEIKIDTFPVVGAIVYKQSSNATKDGYNLDVRDNNTINFWVPDGTNWNGISASITSGVWHHIVATYNKINSKIYIDGIEKVSGNYTNSLIVASQNLQIGGREDDNNDYFDGLIDETRIFNVVCSSAYIKANDYNLRLNTLLSYGAIRANTNSLFFGSNF